MPLEERVRKRTGRLVCVYRCPNRRLRPTLARARGGPAVPVPGQTRSVPCPCRTGPGTVLGWQPKPDPWALFHAGRVGLARPFSRVLAPAPPALLHLLASASSPCRRSRRGVASPDSCSSRRDMEAAVPVVLVGKRRRGGGAADRQLAKEVRDGEEEVRRRGAMSLRFATTSHESRGDGGGGGLAWRLWGVGQMGELGH